ERRGFGVLRSALNAHLIGQGGGRGRGGGGGGAAYGNRLSQRVGRGNGETSVRLGSNSLHRANPGRVERRYLIDIARANGLTTPGRQQEGKLKVLRVAVVSLLLAVSLIR